MGTDNEIIIIYVEKLLSTSSISLQSAPYAFQKFNQHGTNDFITTSRMEKENS